MNYLVDHGSFGNLFRLILKGYTHDLQTSRPLPFGGLHARANIFAGFLTRKHAV